MLNFSKVALGWASLSLFEAYNENIFNCIKGVDAGNKAWSSKFISSTRTNYSTENAFKKRSHAIIAFAVEKQ